MERRTAKELLHIESWLAHVEEIVRRGRRAYLDDVLLQEAGDSLMMKLGEACHERLRGQLAASGGTTLMTLDNAAG